MSHIINSSPEFWLARAGGRNSGASKSCCQRGMLPMNTKSRREFIRLGLQGVAGIAAVWPLSKAALASPPPSSVVGGLRIGCMTWSFRDMSLADALKNIAGIGFSSAELWNGHLDPLKSSESDLTTWKERFTNAGVKITSYFV